MLSSSNVIKNGNVKASGEKKITVNYDIDYKCDKNSNSGAYERLADNIIQNARNKSEKLIASAYEEAIVVQKNAEENGYSIGYKSGSELGYKEGYDKGLEEGRQKAELIIQKAEDIFKNAKSEYENYLEDKANEIKDLIINTISEILKKAVEDPKNVIDVIYEGLKQSKNTKVFIIKCNDSYKEELERKVISWKQSLGFKGDIFILPDNTMEKGKIEINKDNGKIEIDINSSLEKVKEIIKNS
ncbi:flagellar assembly protein FliH [Haloimpatiens sp. FM7315]|uniref:FliH/SctL family protein n=1 Tax=Haloimpatiens sp. FM7315 TaxID=3298609 RepID=UPI0035A2CF88